MEFSYRTKPYEHQREALKAGAARESFGYFMEMGTGKTKVAIDNAHYLHCEKRIDAMVIVAPKGVYLNWSEKELPKHTDPANFLLYTWTGATTQKELAMMGAIQKTKTDKLKIVVVNVEAFSSRRAAEFLRAFLKAHKALMVVDESTTIKNFRAQRTKTLLDLADLTAYRRILTGSPITNSPLDIYTQAKFLDWRLLGYTSYFAFRARYAIIQTIHMGPRSFKKVTGYQRVEELSKKVSAFSFRVTKDECLDLPEKIYTSRDVELTPEQSKAYASMKQLAMVELQEGGISSASIALTQLLRLHQIVCGHLKMDDGSVVEFPNRRLDALMEVLAESTGKVIIWANYVANIRAIVDAIKNEKDEEGGLLYGPESVVEFYGDVSDKDRLENNRAFQDPKSKVRFFVGNQATGGMGIDLYAANTVVYYSNGYKLDDRMQSEDRAHRIGQTKPVTYVDLICKGTVDEKIIQALRNKMNIAQQITGDNYRDWLI
jgi:SNF2 family DNA or RNA helicase